MDELISVDLFITLLCCSASVLLSLSLPQCHNVQSYCSVSPSLSFLLSVPSPDYLKFSSDYSHAVVGGTSTARGMRSASELRDLMDTLQRKKMALENSLRANGNANPSYFSMTQVSCHFALLQC